MTKGLPATLEEAEMAAVEAAAVARARRYVRRLKSGAISALPLELRDSEGAAPWSWFGRENSRAWVKARLKALALNPQRSSFVCGLARAGWICRRRSPPRDHRRIQRARREAAHVAARLRYRDHAVGRPPRRGGWDTTEVFLRDLAIVCVVADICHAFDLPPTRSRASQRHGLSGCLSRRALCMEEREAISESAVVKAWTRTASLSRRRRPAANHRMLPILRYTLADEHKYYDISRKLA